MKITEREKEILKQLAKGKKPKEIAEKLKLSEQTINNHIRWLKRLFEAENTNMLIFEVCSNKII